MRILIAEHDSTSRLILEAALAQLGHEFLSAKDGEEAWRLFQATKVDAVISDRSMPGIDGLELFRRIRTTGDGPYVYFIFLTSLGADVAAEHGMLTGADDYLTKPLNERELIARLTVASRITALYREMAAQKSKLESLNDQLFTQARLDALTQIGTRVKLRDELEAIARRVTDKGATYSAVMCDIDYFKRYNDTYGHIEGDEVLRAAARALMDGSGPRDQIYRYGGEEFLIILPGGQIEDGFTCAERHRTAVERLAIPHGGSPHRVLTISAGVAAFSGTDRGGVKDWLERADAALYRAKQMGRNRVVAADPGSTAPTAAASTMLSTAKTGPAALPPLSSLLAADFSATAGESLDRVLQVIRSHLGMDVAFVSEFTGDRRVFRHVDSAGRAPIQVGDSLPLKEGYCQRVVDGRLPELIPNTSDLPTAMALPVTSTLPIGAHLSVPIRLWDGSLYGTLCAFSYSPNASLNERDLNIMRAFAELASYQIQRNLDAHAKNAEKIRRVRRTIDDRQFASLYQPIYRLDTQQVVGFECLSRFSPQPSRAPDVWFAEAQEVGLGVELELACAGKGVDGLPALPEDVYLALNVSFETIASPEFKGLMQGLPAARLVLEITEHDLISDYERLLRILAPLRRSGMRVAVDDAGAGYASFRHILRIKPDIIKLDRSLIQDVDTDPGRRELAAALVGFARATGSEVLAEGVETASELIAVRLLGAEKAQGYFLGRPMPLADAAALMVPPQPLALLRA